MTMEDDDPIRRIPVRWPVQAWQERMGWSDREVVRALELGSRNTWAKYKAEGAPLYIALACRALEEGLKPRAG